MKIVYVAHSLLSRGGDKMVLAHAGWLIAHGHEVELCCNVVDTVLEIPAGVRFSKPFSPGVFGTILSALLQRRDADIVLASIIPIACFLFPRSSLKVVYFAQDYDETYYSSPLLKRLVRYLYFTGLKLCRIPTIAVSEYLADLLRKRFNANVLVAGNGVDKSIFYPDPDQELVAVKEERKALLLLSRSDHRKGFDIALVVVKALSESSSVPFEVWTVGEPCTVVFSDIIHRDFGYVGENKLRQIMSSSDMFLYPTRHEGFGLMPLEAFACHCPVVTTEAVAFASHLENALVAPVGDVKKLTEYSLQIFSDNTDISRLVKYATQTAENMTLARGLAQFASILEHKVSGAKH